MPDDHDIRIVRLAASSRRGSVIAAAGCGKTEQIVRATHISEGRRLILTHTHAGVDALRMRLEKRRVPKDKFRVDTIAGWCLRYAASFPKRSGLTCDTPREHDEWNAVYESAATLISGGAVKDVLAPSYSGVFVDEYQDCTCLQHQVIKAIAAYLPVCVFGDHLQAIFDFRGQRPVDWDAEVFPFFSKIGELSTPWRWKNAGNEELARWLADARRVLDGGGALDLNIRPRCVAWQNLPNDHRTRQATVVGTCKTVMGRAQEGRVVVIGDSANINMRVALAQKLATAGFSNVEPIGGKTIYDYAEKLERATGFGRLEVIVDIICACMTGGEKTAFLESVRSHQGGRKRGVAKFGDLITTGAAIAQGAADETLIALMDGFHRSRNTRLFRREMFFSMRSALQIISACRDTPLTDALWEVQNRIRHSGRITGKRSIGSTLLVKGLEFDHSVIVHADNMTRKEWYVALTRATSSVTILSPSQCLVPTT